MKWNLQPIILPWFQQLYSKNREYEISLLFDLDKLLQKLAHCTARTTNLLKKFQFEESVTILKCNLSPSHLEINTTRIETHKAAVNERCSSIVEAVFLCLWTWKGNRPCSNKMGHPIFVIQNPIWLKKLLSDTNWCPTSWTFCVPRVCVSPFPVSPGSGEFQLVTKLVMLE